MIFIAVKFSIRPDVVDQWLARVAPFTAATRAEPGNLFFEWSHSVDSPNQFVLLEAFRDHGQHFVEILPRQGFIRPRSAHQVEQLVFAVIGARGLGDDLLREDVERRFVGDDSIELAAPNLSQ